VTEKRTAATSPAELVQYMVGALDDTAAGTPERPRAAPAEG
jgi:hypothetical protein